MKKVALVTGSSSGFGYMTCLALAKADFFVLASMRNLEKQQLLLDAAKAEGLAGSIRTVCLDVTLPDAPSQLVAEIISQHGRIDLLVNNAGFAIGGFVEELPLDAWRSQFETNLYGMIAVTKAVLPHMRKQRSGRIINISSISGRFGFPAMGPYAASKHAVEGFSESLRLEMLPHNVQVVVIEPGAFRTEIWGKSMSAIDVHSDSPYAEQMASIQRQVSETANAAGDPAAVVKAIVKAATARRPRFRYAVGKGVLSSILLKSLLPWRLVESIVAKQIYRQD